LPRLTKKLTDQGKQPYVKDRDRSLITHTTKDTGDMAMILVTDPKMAPYLDKICCLNIAHVQCKIKLCLTKFFFLAHLPYGHMVIWT